VIFTTTGGTTNKCKLSLFWNYYCWLFWWSFNVVFMLLRLRLSSCVLMLK